MVQAGKYEAGWPAQASAPEGSLAELPQKTSEKKGRWQAPIPSCPRLSAVASEKKVSALLMADSGIEGKNSLLSPGPTNSGDDSVKGQKK